MHAHVLNIIFKYHFVHHHHSEGTNYQYLHKLPKTDEKYLIPTTIMHRPSNRAVIRRACLLCPNVHLTNVLLSFSGLGAFPSTIGSERESIFF